ncbi:MAG: hypothetical protein ACHQLQ_15665 [Candidatus Acidiferrales bacterium]
MASQVEIAHYQASSFGEPPPRQRVEFRPAKAVDRELLDTISRAAGDSTGQAGTPEVIAHGVEFVALPGKAAKLQNAIPEAMRNTIGNSRSFSGCIVLVSEQEARLVTVITLWTGRNRVEQCNENAKQVKKLLAPYVDRFLRTRRLAAFLSTR